MYRLTLLTALLISINSYGASLPNSLFSIRLNDHLTNLKDEFQEGRGIIRVNGIRYRYYSKMGKHEALKESPGTLLVQVNESTGHINAIISQSLVHKSDCLHKLERYRREVESDYGIRFPDRSGNHHFTLVEEDKALILSCELKEEALIKFILTNV